MAEEVLSIYNRAAEQPVPLVFVRASIIGASASEPMPGWTDTQGLLSGCTLAVGMGVMKDLQGNPETFMDIVPVDYVARHLLVSAAYSSAKFAQSQGRENLFVI